MPRRPSARTALVAALVAVAASAATAQAASAPAAYTTRDAVVQVTDGPGGHHATALDTRLYVPRGASAAHPAPAVVMTNGFGGSKDDTALRRYGDFLARHGYVVLAYSAQGFGASSGCIRLDDVDYDVRDTSALISKVLAPRRDVLHDAKGPVVGMLGASYGGGLLPLVAEHDPRVRAIVPTWAWNSLQHALMPNDLVAPGDRTGWNLQAPADGVFKAEWTSLFFGYGNAQPLQGHGGCPQEKAAAADPGAAACPGFPDDLCQDFARVAATGSLDPSTRRLLARSSGATWLDRLRVPTLLIQGERDTLFPLSEAIATYTALRRHHVPVAMVWSSDGHGGYAGQPGEGAAWSSDDSLDHGYLSLRTLAWFDRWLKGRPVDTGPGFAYFRDWARNDGHGSDAEQYGSAAAFPAQRGATFHLSGGAGNSGYLVPPGLAPSSGSFQFARLAATSYSETADCSAPGAGSPCPPGLSNVPATDGPGTWVAFTSAPFTRAVDSVGAPSAHLNMTHANGQDLVFFAKVYDVAPDGSQTLVDRLVAPVRVPNGALSKGFDVRLPAFAHRFEKGHAVRLALAASDAAYSLGATAQVPDLITVSFGRIHHVGGGSPYGQTEDLNIEPGESTFTLPVPSIGLVMPFPA